MTTYFAFNTQHGCVGIFDTIPGELKLGRYINVGPAHNSNGAPSRAFVTDDERQFHHELKRCGFGVEWTFRLRDAPRDWYDGVDEQTGELIRRD